MPVEKNVGKKAVDNAVAIGTDALIIADLGVLDYAATKYPDVERHVSVQASTHEPRSDKVL